MCKTRIIITEQTSKSKPDIGDKGFVDGYVFDSRLNVHRAIIVLDKDGSFHTVHHSAIKHDDGKKKANHCEGCNKELESGTVFCTPGCRNHYYN